MRIETAELTETQRLNRIATTVYQLTRCASWTPEILAGDITEGAIRIIRTLGFTRNNGTVDQDFVLAMCEHLKRENPYRLFIGLYLLSTTRNGVPEDCYRCPVERDCDSRFDPANRPEECGE